MKNRRRNFLLFVLAGSACLCIYTHDPLWFLRSSCRSGGHSVTHAHIATLLNTIQEYEIDTGRYPASLDHLLKANGVEGWDGPYLEPSRGVPHDAWNRPFAYSLRLEIRSAGPDGVLETQDDRVRDLAFLPSSLGAGATRASR